MEIVTILLNRELNKKLNDLFEKYSSHKDSLKKSFEGWREDPSYDLSFEYYDEEGDKCIEIASITETREIEELQNAIWASETAFSDAKKYRELISTLKTIKSVFVN